MGGRNLRTINRLTAARVTKLMQPGKFADGGNLYLQVTASKSGAPSKSWLFVFQSPVHAREREMGLGPLHTIGLADARELARQARRLILDGKDPIDVRKAAEMQARLDVATAVTFQDCGGRYIEAHKDSWKNAKHHAQWGATLKTYAYPVLGALAVASIDTGLVLKVIEPIWKTKPETASRVRMRIETVLDWATARHYRTGLNPARWRGHMDQLLPAKSKVRALRHHPALPYPEVPGFVTELRDLEGIGPRALESAILTATRTNEVIGARWDEIKLDEALWTIPPERMKAGREHRVPLSPRTIAILKELPREKKNPYVFIGPGEGRPLSNMALLATIKRMGRSGITVHGFRSSFRDWAAEQTSYANEVCEAALAHTISDKAEAAYRRGDLFEKRRRLMNDWAAYATAKPAKGELVPIRKGKGHG